MSWLDQETLVGIEESAGTACALSTLGLRSGRNDLVSFARRILFSLDTRICPAVKLLRTAAEAEVAHAKRQWKRLARLERSADEQIRKLDPADHWEVKAVFEYLRRSATKGKETHAGA